MTTAIEPQFAVSFPATLPALSISDSQIRGTAEALGTVLDFRSRALPALEKIASDKGTNTVGKTEAWTAFAETALASLYEARTKIDADRSALGTRIAAVEAAGQVAVPTTPVEVQNMWATESWYRAQTPAKQRELTDQMARGELTDLRDRLLALPEYACPLAGPIRTMLYAERISANVDHAAVARLNAQAEHIATATHILSAHIVATESGADKDRLRAKGFDIPKGRGDMTDREKSDFIDQKGLPAFEKLSA